MGALKRYERVLGAISQSVLHQSQSNSIEDLTAADMARLKSGDKVVMTITDADEYDLYTSLVVGNA